MTLGELNRILDDWCDVKVVPNNGDGDELDLTTKTRSITSTNTNSTKLRSSRKEMGTS